MTPDAVEWQERLDALRCLIFAPFPAFLLILVTAAIVVTCYLERPGK